MKKLLVTGGLGFIGSTFIKYILNKYDYRIINLDKVTYCANFENLKDIEKNKNYKFVRGDICDEKIVGKLMNGCDFVINFAAETHVDRSIEDPSSFIKTDVLGMHNLLEAAQEYNINKFLQISCYDENTRTLTTDGLKRYNELKRGDLVFSLNPKTSEIEIKPIEKVIIQEYDGKMIHFKNKRIDLCVTPNHNMFILQTNKKLTVETAEKCSKRSIFYMPEGKWIGKNEEYFDLDGHGRVKTEDLMYILGIFIGDGFTAYQEKELETKSGLNRAEFLKVARDKNTGKFKRIESPKNYKTIKHSYRIFFDIPENDKCRKKVEQTLNNLGVNYHCHKGKAGTHVYFTSKEFMKLFEQCGKGAHNKHIPRWALAFSQRYLKHLLDGLMDSDGTGRKIYSTVSEKLLSDICELCLKLNLKPSIHKRHTISFINKRKIEGDSYYIFIAKTARSISRNRIKEIAYKGKIWCLKVKDNKNFIVERKGRFDFCGNTDEVYGSIEKGSFKETDRLNPSSPYSASKASADLLAYSHWKTYHTPVIVTRSSNNFGPYQYPEKLIPLFITNLLEGKKIPLYGDGLNVRDWIYVLDNCEAIDFILHNGILGEIYNIGGGNEKTNIDVTRLILAEIGRDETFIEHVKDRPGHDRRYALNCQKINKLGWKPEYKFEEALNETIKWYKSNQAWWKKIKSGEYLRYYTRHYKERHGMKG